jgi:hypothetical protein
MALCCVGSQPSRTFTKGTRGPHAPARRRGQVLQVDRGSPGTGPPGPALAGLANAWYGLGQRQRQIRGGGTADSWQRGRPRSRVVNRARGL